ncbi:MAG: glycosyltransferase family 2 protein [Ferruginibacter sp.]
MTDQPMVSVLMTAYNRETYIAEAIESVLASSYTNFELIIVDDCSKDGTVEIALAFAAIDTRIKVYVNEKNLDQFPNRNKAADYAIGYLIMFVDSDDTIQPDAIEYVVRQFSEHPTAKFSTVYGQADIDKPTCMSSAECVRKHFFKSNHLHVGPGGTVIKTTYFKQIGGFPTVYGPAGDSYYNIKAACNADVLLLPYIYFNYRIHGNQELSRKDSYLYNNYLYFESVMLLPELPLTQKEKRKLLLNNKRQFLINSLVHLKNTGHFGKVISAYKTAGVGIKEIWAGIFQ